MAVRNRSAVSPYGEAEAGRPRPLVAPYSSDFAMMKMLRPLLFTSLLLGMAWPCQGQEAIPAMGNRELSLVVSTPEATFYSDFWLNLHDYLYGRVREELPEEGADCIAALSDAERGAWRTAEAFYEAEMPDRHHRRDPLIRAIRHRLAETATEHDPLADSALEILAAAAPAYRACLWDIHDARNRDRIGELLRVVVSHGPALRRYLERAYRSDWPAGIVVDVAPYAAFANTSGGRGMEPHMMLSNSDPRLLGWSGLEILFHEGSHAMFGAGHGEVASAFRRASEALGVEQPGQLWHALSFHTSGRIVQEMAAAEGDEYTPYYLRRGIFTDFAAVFDEHWNPYLYGETTMDDAAHAVLRALSPS